MMNVCPQRQIKQCVILVLESEFTLRKHSRLTSTAANIWTGCGLLTTPEECQESKCV